MKFTFENLGPIEKAELDLKDLTILVGGNNTGKTYILHSIYRLLDQYFYRINETPFQELRREILQKYPEPFEISIDDYFERVGTIFEITDPKDLFNIDEDIFKNIKVSLDCEYKNENGLEIIQETIRSASERKIDVRVFRFNYRPSVTKRYKKLSDITGFTAPWGHHSKRNPYFISAERLGIFTFYESLKEYKRKAFALEHHRKFSKIDKDHINDMKEDDILYVKERASRISYLIMNNIWPHSYYDYEKLNPKLTDEGYLDSLFNLLINGFCINKARRYYPRLINLKEEFSIDFRFASSSVRGIYELFLAAKEATPFAFGKRTHILIEEPEANLTLRNQRVMAKLLVALVNSGIKVIITTHSDILVKEVNNLIKLNKEFKGKASFLQEHDFYTEHDKIDHTKVGIFIAENRSLTSVNITENGFDVPFFDQELTDIYQTSTDLDYYRDDED